ncbi:hypothetical protein PV391_38630, partial [Streptomyces scabiei]|nr:hypothetical protein [Streptomyces scabiei]
MSRRACQDNRPTATGLSGREPHPGNGPHTGNPVRTTAAAPQSHPDDSPTPAAHADSPIRAATATSPATSSGRRQRLTTTAADDGRYPAR